MRAVGRSLVLRRAHERPRSLGLPAGLDDRRGRIFEPHVRPLNRLVEGIVAAGHSVPWVDPLSGGVKSRILFLLESPGPRASAKYGSGFVSPDNDDQTAERFWRLSRQAKLDRADFVNWNVVPWYVSKTAKNANALWRDWSDAVPWLHRFVALLPLLRVVVPMGGFAERCWLHYLRWPKAPVVALVPTAHPSVQSRRGRPDFEREILTAMRKARLAASGR